MKDFFGQELSIGDDVAFEPPTYRGLVRGKVVAFTPQKIRVQYVTRMGPSDASTLIDENCCVKKPKVFA